MEKALQQDPTDCLKIVLYGPESTGKTTLARSLAAAYNTSWVPEYARDYLQKKWENTGEVCNLEDLIHIAQGQLEEENKAVKSAKKIVFCDTNILVTQLWSETHFEGYCDPRIIKWAQSFHYDYYFLTATDIPWEADDLRDRPNHRVAMFNAFQAKLREKNLPYTVLAGQHEVRMKKAMAQITQLLQQ